MASLWQVGADDRRGVVRSVRVGVAVSLGSAFCFVPPPFGGTVLWASMAVAVVFRYAVACATEYFRVVESGDEGSDEDDAISEVCKSLPSSNSTEKALALCSLRAQCMSIGAESAKVVWESIKTVARVPNAELTLDGSTTVLKDLQNSLQAQPEHLVEADNMRCAQISGEEQSSEPSETSGVPKSDQRPCHVSRKGGMQAGQGKRQYRLREVKLIDFCFPEVLPLAIFASLVSRSVAVSVDELGKQAEFKTMDEKRQTAKPFVSSQTSPTPTKPPPSQKITPSPPASKPLMLITSTVLVQIAKPGKIETIEENGRRTK